jgi:hypothetical protein
MCGFSINDRLGYESSDEVIVFGARFGHGEMNGGLEIASCYGPGPVVL